MDLNTNNKHNQEAQAATNATENNAKLMSLILGEDEDEKERERRQRMSAPASTLKSSIDKGKTKQPSPLAGKALPQPSMLRSKSVPVENGNDRLALEELFKQQEREHQLGQSYQNHYFGGDMSASALSDADGSTSLGASHRDSSRRRPRRSSPPGVGQDDTTSTPRRSNNNRKSTYRDSIAAATGHAVPEAPGGKLQKEEEEMDEDMKLKKEASEFDLMKMVARRSHVHDMSWDENDDEDDSGTEDKDNTEKSDGVESCAYYYNGSEDQNHERRNIKQAGPALGAAPGAYGAAPGSQPRRVRSIRFSDVGQQSQEINDAAYADYLQRETDKLDGGKQPAAASANSAGRTASTKSLDPEQPPFFSSSNYNSNSNHGREKKEGAKMGGTMMVEAGTKSASSMGLVEARAVTGESTGTVLGNADFYDGPMEEEKQHERDQKRHQYLGTICCLVVIPVLIVLILWWSGVFERAKKEDTVVVLTEAPTGAPSGSPTAAPTLYFLPLPDYTVEAIRNDPIDSPQAMAYQWIQEDPNFDGYSDARKQQRFALVTFFYATNGDLGSWTLQENWLDYNIHECEWFSKWINLGPDQPTVCDEEGNYLSLQLTLNDLSGSLVPELGMLSRLIVLDVATNNIGGTLPSELGLLTKLTDLSLDVNALTGPLPSELGQMDSLELLIIHTNKGLTGTIPTSFGNLTALTAFEASGGQLSGAIPSEMGLMTSLTTLTLHKNSLEGSIPLELWNLTSLSSFLNLNSNALTGTLATEVGKLSNLEDLRIYSTDMTGSLPSELGTMTKLRYVDLCCSSFDGFLPSEIGLLNQLEKVYMEYNIFSGLLPSEVGMAQKLLRLNLPGNDFSGALPSEISQLGELTTLSLYINSFSGPLPSELGLMHNLTVLDMESNAFNASLPSELGQMSSLEVLWLGDNRIASTLPTELGLLSNSLEELAIHSVNLFGFLPTEVGLLSKMTYLDLSRTNLVGPLRSELGLVPSLETFYIEGTFFQGAIPKELEIWNATLSEMVMQNTFLTGTIPSAFCSVPSLHFDCSDTFCGCDCPCQFAAQAHVQSPPDRHSPADDSVGVRR